jgi:D-alanyl-D-alanine dipeptidase
MQHTRFALASFARTRQGKWGWKRVTPVLVAATVAASCGPRLVALETLAPTVRQDMRYAGADNFVGVPIDGYRAARCRLSVPAARALARVAEDVAGVELTLVVFDCYRPQRAVDHFLRWAADGADQHTKATYYPIVSKGELFSQGYVAERSGHSRGSTVDVTLARVDGARVAPLDMGTPFDFFDPRSHASSREVTAEQRANRRRLRTVMERHGFRPYEPEWWHFTLAAEPYPDRYFDVPVE